MKHKALEKRIDDLEQRMARLETLDDQLSRDVLAMKGTAKRIKLKRLGPSEEKPHCLTCGECPYFPGNGNICWQKEGYKMAVQADRPNCHDRGGLL